MSSRQPDEQIVVTGIGGVTPIGNGAEGIWQGVMSGRSAVDTVTSFDPSPFATHIGAEVRDFDPTAYLDAKQIRRLDRYSQFAVASAAMAFQDASLDPGTVDNNRVGVSLGTALGGISYAEKEHLSYIQHGLRSVSPMLALSIFAGAGSCNIAIEYGFTGPTTANGDSCASAPIALGNALHYLRRGEADIMIAGGSEAPLSPLVFGAFALIRAMSTRNDDPRTASRPFDKDRDGFVMAEGAAALILEELEHALNRGATIYAEIVGGGMAADAYHLTGTHPEGLGAVLGMQKAITDAQISSAEIDYINAHATSTPLGDNSELLAINTLFEDLPVAISATKSMHGHLLGAAGAIEAIICILAVKHNIIPPTINTETMDDEAVKDLHIVLKTSLAKTVNFAINNTFGFGGHTASSLFKKYTG